MTHRTGRPANKIKSIRDKSEKEYDGSWSINGSGAVVCFSAALEIIHGLLVELNVDIICR